MNSEPRVAALRDRLVTERVEAMAITDPVNVAYITGFERVFDEEEAHVALVTASEVRLFTDGRYVEAASSAASGTSWQITQLSRDMLQAVSARCSEVGVSTLAVEDTLAQRRFATFEDSFEGELRTAHDWVEELRNIKTAEEIERIEAAQELTDRAFEHILAFIRVGTTEREVALELEFFMRRNGSDGVAFPPIIASGPNSALPHAKVTDRAVRAGEFLKMDFGAKVDGYCADMTRTVVIGHSSERQRELYGAVLAANAAGEAAIGAGVAGKEVDAAARKVLEDAGMGDLFTHGLGHGVGMQVHELPSVGPRGEAPLPERSVVTVEPGVYVAGFGGVRIEDLVVVEAHGARVLTRSPKDLIEL